MAVSTANLERDLAAATRRVERARAKLSEEEAERDRVIRDALAAKLGPARVGEITGLSKQRLHQIRHDD